MKVGIVADNFKLDEFKTRLKKADYPFTTGKFTENTTTIFVTARPDNINELHQLCKDVERYFADMRKH